MLLSGGRRNAGASARLVQNAPRNQTSPETDESVALAIKSAEIPMPLRFGILVFPNVMQLDLTGPYEVFSLVKDAEVLLVWKDRAPVISSTKLSLTPTAT